ncbi:MAG: acyltransferase family protein [Chloroflexi bacterium]|nr:acyltransferase family protein [Chloroflexota bacterium]
MTDRSGHQRVSLAYMPGLDGLRAVAVGAVFLYHAGFWWAAGGFLGVETFFVLSGYLITSLLLLDVRFYKRVRLGRFWLRRARRLWPALWFLLLGVVFLARGWAPDAWPRLKQDLPAALTYTTNILYIVRQIPYFERFGRPPLLQHLWSLAVEEQFYLFWPLLLWGLLRLLRVQVGEKYMARLTLAILGLVVASTLWMVWQYDPMGDPMRLYYGTDTRAAGFLLGGALATFWPPGGHKRWARPADILGWLGLIGLIVLYWRMDEFQESLYRGGFLLTATATAAVMLAATSSHTLLGRFLGWPPLRWIGTRSYAIYLWHWPLLAVFRPGFECTWPLGWCAVLHAVATGLLAEVSYRVVEQPIRKKGFRVWAREVWQRGRGWGTALAVIGLTLATAWAVAGLSRGEESGHASLSSVAEAENQPVPGQSTLFPTASWPAASEPSPTLVPVVEATAGCPQSTPAPTASTGPLVTVLGDSILQASVTFDFWAPWGKAVYVDAEPGRNIRDIPRLAAELAEKHLLGPVVVLHLGTNAPFDEDALADALEALKTYGAKRFFLLNIRRPVPWEDKFNAQLAEAVAQWPEATLLDWHALAAAHPEWFVDDRTHLRYYGAKEYVSFVMTHVWPVAQALQEAAAGSQRAACTPHPPAPTVTPTPVPTPTLAPTRQATPTPAGLRLTLIGDSIMLSTLPVWREILPSETFYMDAAQGRRMAHLLTLVPELAKDGHLARVAVVHLGTNGSFSDATFDAVMTEFLAHGVERVYFVNVRSPIRWAPLANRQLASGVARWPEQAVLLDWEAYATPHRDWFYDDFAHPTPEGARAYVKFILDALGWSGDLEEAGDG